MSQVGIRHHWQRQMPISEYVPLPSYLLAEVLPIVIISCHLIYLRFLLRNPLKAQCTYQVECCYIDPQLEFAKSWETLHLYIKQFACCSRWAKALLWAGSTNNNFIWIWQCWQIHLNIVIMMTFLHCNERLFSWIHFDIKASSFNPDGSLSRTWK